MTNQLISFGAIDTDGVNATITGSAGYFTDKMGETIYSVSGAKTFLADEIPTELLMQVVVEMTDGVDFNTSSFTCVVESTNFDEASADDVTLDGFVNSVSYG